MKAESLSGTFSYCYFDVPGGTPYLETYLSVSGRSVQLVDLGNHILQGQIEVQWILREGEKIVHYDKYNLISPAIEAHASIPDFIDQQRVPLDPGTYQLELKLRDKNSGAGESTLRQEIKVKTSPDSISISDIELVESYRRADTAGKFTKSGYDLVPNVNPFYPKEKNSLKFYAEIYRSDVIPAEEYLVRYYLSNNESRQLLDRYMVSTKQPPRRVNSLLGEIPLTDLFSGNYNLNIEVRNKKNKLLAFKQIFFQRSNVPNKPLVSSDIAAIDVTNTFISPVTSPDTLAEYIACLYPISSGLEAETGENQIRLADVRSMQQYIYYFWSRRNAADPEKAWLDYKAEVQKANDAFSTQIKKGYETDRGRVYLQYGAPNIISDNKDEPAAYPYEIWQYYKLKNQTNRKFVFYSRERSSNEYRLLHSDAIGEIYQANWQLKLYDRTQQFGSDFEQITPASIYGGNTEDNFSNPR
jgi:GWxTD domain-containing protein